MAYEVGGGVIGVEVGWGEGGGKGGGGRRVCIDRLIH